MPRTFQQRIWRRNGDEVVEDTKQIELDPDLLAMTGDLEADADDVAANIGLVVGLLGDYEEFLAVADAEYRAWSAEKFISVKKDDRSGKVPSDEVAKKAVEADETFLQHKRGIASLEGDYKHLTAYFEGLRLKVQLIQAKTAQRNRQQAGEEGMNTSERAPLGRSAVRQPADHDKMRDTLRRGRENREEE